jgi:hypothetical protein
VNSRLNILSPIFKQEGTARQQRYLPALHPGNIAIDDRRLKDLLLYVQRFSGNLLFIPGSGEKLGEDWKASPETWNDILRKDIALLLAHIAACPVAEIGEVYLAFQQSFDSQRTGSRFNPLVDHAFSVFERLDEWYDRAAAESPDSKLRKDLQLYIQSYLSKKLADLRQIRLHARILTGEQHLSAPHEPISAPHEPISAPHEPISALSEPISAPPGTIFRNTDQVWGDEGAADRSFGERVFIGRDDEEKLINASLRLKEIFDTAYHVLSQVVANCNAYLEETLNARRDHQPHIALLITFLQLYEYSRDEINKIPQRHLDFYYGQLLGIRPRKAVPDSAFVNVELEKGFEACELKKGSLLSAGKDGIGKEMAYETVSTLVVNTAKVSAIRTLFIEKDRHNQVLQYYPTAADLPAAAGTPGLSLRPFGDKTGAAGARIGFAIASAQLYLTRGERQVVLRFELDKDILIAQFDKSLLELMLTGEKGWLSSDRTADGIRINSITTKEGRALELDFTISIGQPLAIIAFDGRIHGGDFETDLPILQCLLKYPCLPQDDRELAAYRNKIIQLNSLQKIRPLNTVISVQVGSLGASASFDGVKDLVLQNHEAALDPKKPFFPFTSVPKVGSSFYIGCDDLFYKPIQQLSLNMEWMLPDHFHTYYDKYMPPYDSNKFRASLSILINKKWRKIRDISIIDADSSDPRWRSVPVDLRPFNDDADKAETASGIARFDVSKMDGTLKLKLNYPDFGHGIYSQLITSSVMEKASSGPAMPDFYKRIKHLLHDSVFSIKLPPDLDDRNGSFKVVIYEILESDEPDEKARSMMIKGVSGMMRYFNDEYSRTGSAITLDHSGSPAAPPPAAGAPAVPPPPAGGEEERAIVNKDGFLERILRKLRLIGSTESFEKGRDSVDDVVGEVKRKILPETNFILPGKMELAGIIDDVTGSAIDQTSVKVVDRMLALRKDKVGGAAIAAIFKEEFEEANKVINDMVAKKIASVLMAGEIPPPPYTPVINMISLNYRSSRPCTEEQDRFFQLGPFGHAAIRPGDALFDETRLRLPAGQLFIGIRDWKPGQQLALLFRFEEGSGRTDKTPPGISWTYLAGNEWKPLSDKYLVSDGTYGLQTTGILQFSLPEEALNTTTLFDVRGLYWLSASVSGEIDAFPNLADLAPHAVLARFRDQGNDPCHEALPLPAGRITRLVDKLPGIKKVSQPVPSFGGNPAEEQGEYYTRVSERLRHKSRAIGNWDYERLVLENFPGVYKVKCLNDYVDGCFVRGHVTVVPVCEPRASLRLLREIETFLAEKVSPFVKVHAINPELSYVLIRCRVKFRKGVDKGFALQKLDRDLIGLLSLTWPAPPNTVSHPLSPGASGADKGTFSAKIYASSMISFIGNKEEVDYVEELEMQQYVEDEKGEKVFCRASNQDISLVETQFINGHTLLASAPAHELEGID